MRKYLQEEGYVFKADYDDLTNKQFSLVSANYNNSETSILGSKKLDREEVYSLFIRDFDGAILKTRLESVINSALSDNVSVTLSNNIEVERVENGYNVTMAFYIQG